MSQPRARHRAQRHRRGIHWASRGEPAFVLFDNVPGIAGTRALSVRGLPAERGRPRYQSSTYLAVAGGGGLPQLAPDHLWACGPRGFERSQSERSQSRFAWYSAGLIAALRSGRPARASYCGSIPSPSWRAPRAGACAASRAEPTPLRHAPGVASGAAASPPALGPGNTAFSRASRSGESRSSVLTSTTRLRTRSKRTCLECCSSANARAAGSRWRSWGCLPVSSAAGVSPILRYTLGGRRMRSSARSIDAREPVRGPSDWQ